MKKTFETWNEAHGLIAVYGSRGEAMAAADADDRVRFVMRRDEDGRLSEVAEFAP